MGVARFLGINVDAILLEIRQSGETEFEKRRRELDIEIEISKAIQNLLNNNANVTFQQIGNEINQKVVQIYNQYTAGVAATAHGNQPPPWPFTR